MPSASLILLCLALAGPAAAQPASAPPQLPAGPASQRLGAFLEAFGSGDTARLRAFIQASYATASLAERPAAERAAFLHRAFQDQGALRLEKVDAAAPDSVDAVVVGAASGRRLRLHLAVDPTPPHKILGVGLETIEEEDEAPPIPLPAPRDRAAAKAVIGRLIGEEGRAERFSGSVLVELDGRELVSAATGLADRSSSTPIRLDTRMNLGSINKIFTRVAIAHLAQEGKLKLSDRLVELWPDYPNATVARQVTVDQLVEHRAGLGDIFGPRYDAAPPGKLLTLRDFLGLFVDQPPLFPPGSSQRYSNAGYVVLGLLIERLSGKTYYEAIRDWVYQPAGMTDSDSFRRDEKVANRAIGYTRESASQSWRPNTDTLPGRGSSAGGGYSTAPDLLRFVHALLADELLEAGWTDWVLGGPAPRVGTGPADVGHHTVGVGWAGGTRGVNALVEIERGTILIVLANQDPPAAVALGAKIRGILRQIERP
ncbi:MAG: serine hydrolase domain-containing protein [Acidobacteriota bacterium]